MIPMRAFCTILSATIAISFVVPTKALGSESSQSIERSREDTSNLVFFDPNAQPYRTPRAGEGFKTSVFGEEVTVPERNLGHVSGWKVGAQFETPQPEDRLVLPAAALYFWRRPNEKELFRAEVAVVYNNIFWAVKPEGWGDFEIGLTFNNFTLPSRWDEAYDGEIDNREEIFWGYVRPGLTLGYRKQLPTGRQDNMWQLSYVLEPGYFYTKDSGDTDADFELPQSTFELRNRIMFRFDSLERNILSLPHQGFAFGADFVHGYRFDWDDWGTPENRVKENDGNDYLNVSGYAIGSTGLPFASERHRIVSWLHAAAGHDLDRFSATRIGGGPNAMGMEYGASALPILPGTTIWEFYPEHYLIGALEYRYEVAWFTYVTAHGGAGVLNPFRPVSPGSTTLRRSEELLPWMGLRISTGFIGDTMLMIDYAHSFNLVNEDERGGNELMLWLSGEF